MAFSWGESEYSVSGNGSDKDSDLIKIARNEYLSFLFRFVTSACAMLATWFIFDIKISTNELRKEFIEYKITQEGRVAKVEGTLAVVDNSIRMHSRTLETHENTMQSFWSRMYDMNSRVYGSTPMTTRPIP